MVRDPYLLDFLDLSEPVAECELEAALMDKLQALLLELGHGFAFIGRQYRFAVDGDEFHITKPNRSAGLKAVGTSSTTCAD